MKKEHCRTVLYGVVAIVAMLLLWMGVNHIPDTEKIPVDVMFMGDSLIGANRGGTSIPYYVATDLDIQASNVAFGGSTFSKMSEKPTKYYERDALSFVDLIKALVHEDFGPQQMMRLREYATEDFGVTVDEMSKVDFGTVKVLVLEYGTNDYNGYRPIENPDDPMDKYTVKGALRSALTLLQKEREDLRIIILSPTYIWFLDTLETCEDRDYGDGTLEDYVEAIKEVAEEFGVEFVDLYHDFYPHESFEDWKNYTDDGIHPNQAARRKIADKLITLLQN